jgi:dUTP diphosphatase
LKLLSNKEKIKGSYQVRYKYFYKNDNSDLKNVTSVIDKFFNDALQKLGIVENDNVKYFKESIDRVGGMDKKNPRIEIEVEGIRGIMEALKTFDIKELLRRQAMLDEKFDEKETVNIRTIEGIQVALITEIGELSQELKSEWNYWKNSTEKFNKSKVLEELSDVLHFYLSYINAEDEETRGRVIPFLDEFLVEYNRGVLSKQSLEDKLLTLSDFRTLNENKVLGCILDISDYVKATEEEFLKIHHEKWLKNMNERTKESY